GAVGGVLAGRRPFRPRWCAQLGGASGRGDRSRSARSRSREDDRRDDVVRLLSFVPGGRAGSGGQARRRPGGRRRGTRPLRERVGALPRARALTAAGIVAGTTWGRRGGRSVAAPSDRVGADSPGASVGAPRRNDTRRASASGGTPGRGAIASPPDLRLVHGRL